MSVGQALRTFARIGADLGESPVWDETTGTLYCLDISRGRILALDEQAGLTTLYRCAGRVGALALTEAGNLIFTEDAGVAILDRQTLLVSHRAPAVSHVASYRFNDGACDPQGRFVTGLMDEAHSQKTGLLLRYDGALNATLLQDQLGLPNGLAWSEEGRELFFVDSVARTIYRADYFADGRFGPPGVFVETPAHLGRPDGLALDCEGGLWVCQFNGGCLLRYDRHGVLTDTLAVPVPRPTSCCFGGEDMRTLYITTARFAMTPAELADFPDAGNLYAVRLQVPGCKRHRFKEG